MLRFVLVSNCIQSVYVKETPHRFKVNFVYTAISLNWSKYIMFDYMASF